MRVAANGAYGRAEGGGKVAALSAFLTWNILYSLPSKKLRELLHLLNLSYIVESTTHHPVIHWQL